jgi:GH18 family chitinase
MKDKVDYININSLGGAMIWEIGQDDLSEFLVKFYDFLF